MTSRGRSWGRVEELVYRFGGGRGRGKWGGIGGGGGWERAAVRVENGVGRSIFVFNFPPMLCEGKIKTDQRRGLEGKVAGPPGGLTDEEVLFVEELEELRVTREEDSVEGGLRKDAFC